MNPHRKKMVRPPHWAKAVRDWLNSNMQQRRIGRGGVEDITIPWPARLIQHCAKKKTENGY